LQWPPNSEHVKQRGIEYKQRAIEYKQRAIEYKQRGIKHSWKGIRLLPLLTSYVSLGKDQRLRC
jgi:hypothetical protein